MLTGDLFAVANLLQFLPLLLLVNRSLYTGILRTFDFTGLGSVYGNAVSRTFGFLNLFLWCIL